MRILISECKQEVSSFNPVLSHYEDFLIDKGEAVLAYHRPVRNEAGGAIHVFEQHGGVELVGGYSAKGITSAGTLSAAAFRRIAGEFLDAVRAHRDVDAIYFALHGALAAEDVDDCEGYLLEQTRAIAGPHMPIAASFDLHGILTDRILTHLDVFTVFHTNPHVDFFETGQRAARLLLRFLQGGLDPAAVRVKIPALVRGQECITSTGTIKRCYDRAIAFENSPSGLSGSLFIGNPFTDVPDLCSNVILLADGDSAAAEAEAISIANEFWAIRHHLQQPLVPLAEAAVAAATAKGRVVLVDAADATSSGASGDSNAIVRALMEAGNRRTCLAPIVDAPAVDAAFQAGIGATLEVTVGGQLDPKRFPPLPIRAKVRVLSDGRLRSESHGESWYAGRTAVLEADNYTIVATTRPVSLYDRTLFLGNGQDPALFDMTVVKSPLCQPRFFNDGAEKVLNIDAPGATSANVKGLGHTVVERPLWPLDEIDSYQPRAKVFRRAK
ncbi:MAG: M81 family metallopeptidase [Acidobacteria bacterium]|nr:M81 family metallopeptidase [Acidobacteriota bacterium]